MTDSLTLINELKPVAARMREREEQIDAIRREVTAHMAGGLDLMSEQGRDIILVKARLGKAFKFTEWRDINVPNLPEAVAVKYERIAVERLDDPRQCVFAFLPEGERQTKPRRTPAAPWESATRVILSLRRILRDHPPAKWPAIQRANAASDLEPAARAFWPDQFDTQSRVGGASHNAQVTC